MSESEGDLLNRTLADAVADLVPCGAVVGVGGQNISRCAVASALEIIRQGIDGLTLVGCNLSLHADLLVGAGRVRRLECGTGNLERYGVTHRMARAMEEGRIEIEDYDHAAMVARFVAAGMGAPFLPVGHLEGSDLLESSTGAEPAKFATVQNPWAPHQPVRLAPALSPDVSLVHAHEADAEGNVRILGPASHDPELIRASQSVICTVEQIRRGVLFDSETTGTVVPALFLTAVVEAPNGAWPTSTPGRYDHDDGALKEYQALAKQGGPDYHDHVAQWTRRP